MERAKEVVSGRVIEQFIVEGHDIGEQQVFMEVDEFLLDSAIIRLELYFRNRKIRCDTCN